MKRACKGSSFCKFAKRSVLSLHHNALSSLEICPKRGLAKSVLTLVSSYFFNLMYLSLSRSCVAFFERFRQEKVTSLEIFLRWPIRVSSMLSRSSLPLRTSNRLKEDFKLCLGWYRMLYWSTGVYIYIWFMSLFRLQSKYNKVRRVLNDMNCV